MTLNSLCDLLKVIQQRPEWETYHRYREVQKHWKSVIYHKFADKTRPVAVIRQVLWVATESSVIAQHLSLQRRTLLQKLNPLLSQPLRDIRFSSAQWFEQHSQDLIEEIEENSIYRKETVITTDKSQESPKTLSDAFEGWAEVVRERSQQLPLCPRCQSPTELWELQRWSVCGYCAFQDK